MRDGNRVTNLLQRGIAAAKAGQKQEAREILLQVTELDERNETAWLRLPAQALKMLPVIAHQS